MTKRWYRSPRGKILGVATGLAEWRDLPADPVRLIVFLAILFTGFFPGAIIYLIVALCLPASEEDYQTNFKKSTRMPRMLTITRLRKKRVMTTLELSMKT